MFKCIYITTSAQKWHYSIYVNNIYLVKMLVLDIIEQIKMGILHFTKLA